jgi:hypothetical protein
MIIDFREPIERTTPSARQALERRMQRVGTEARSTSWRKFWSLW